MPTEVRGTQGEHLSASWSDESGSGAIPTGYNTPVPAGITTPDRVETRLGALEFADGIPSAQTARTVLDHLALIRGVETFLSGIPAASVEATRVGNEAMGVTVPNHVLILDSLLDSNPLFLTGNTDTVYASGFFDLGRYGPTVVEIPPNCGPGTVNDAWFRFVTPPPDGSRRTEHRLQ